MPKKLFVLLSFVVIMTSSCKSEKKPQLTVATEPSYDLVKRIVPGYENQFSFEIIEKENNKDIFEISTKNGNIHLKGNNEVSIASAFHWYLKNECNAHLSWNGDRLDLPKNLPRPTTVTKKSIDAKNRVYFNYCTFNYTASWWDWERWQREIDYMAMNGVNMPLSIVGLEGVWYKTLLKFNFSDTEAREFLVSPAHFAWQWMNNIQGQGELLPKSWIDSHIALGQKIINRQLELGMQPIQQGFTGYVPRKMKEKFKDATILIEKDWWGFDGTAQLDPLDPLFKKFGTAFLETQKELFGAYGVYAADPFHEGEPPQEGKEYLNKVGKAIYGLMQNFDPNAVWAMQSWSIKKDIATIVPKGKLLVLDLSGWKWSSLDNVWGYDFVVGNLHNFGGRTNMPGDLALLASNQYQYAKRKAPNATGSGLFMESIMQNPIYYDLAFEMTFYNDSININQWLKKYAKRRYGINSKKIDKAMQLLLNNPYKKGTNGVEKSSIICARPAINAKKSGPNSGFGIPYQPTELIKALELLTDESEKLGASDGYRFDIVDIERQTLTNLGQVIHKKIAKAFKDKNLKAYDLHVKRFLDLLMDTDMLLRTRSEFSFGKWVADARSWGQTEEEKDLYEMNASKIVTHWGGDGDSLIFDYSWREWSGLIGSYYYPRWEKFYAMLRTHLVNGTEYDEESLPKAQGRETLRANAFYNELTRWEERWINSQKNISPIPEGDEIDITKTMLKKYNPLFSEYYN